MLIGVGYEVWLASKTVVKTQLVLSLKDSLKRKFLSKIIIFTWLIIHFVWPNSENLPNEQQTSIFNLKDT